MIDSIVDAKESVVYLLEGLQVDGLVLSIVLRKVERNLLRDALGVNGGQNLGFTLVEHRQDGIIYIVAEKNHIPVKLMWDFLYLCQPKTSLTILCG